MKTYSDDLVQRLSQAHETLNVNGVTVRVKPMPDERRPGYLEAREIQMMVEAQAAGTAGFRPNMTLNDMREMMGFPNRNLNTVEIHTRYEEHRFGENLVKLWIHWPRKPEGKKNHPCLIYLHGGGWIGGSVFTVENPCRLIAELADAVVVNVDYNLAPERPYPNGFNDCYAVLSHIHAHAADYGIDRERIAMAGDSAGGNLTAACALRDRDEGTGMLKLQILIYPAVTLAETTKGYTFDVSAYDIAPEHRDLILPAVMALASGGVSPMTAMYLAGDAKLTTSPYVSPLCAERFDDLPPALIVTPEFDGLRLQGEAYAKALKDAGVAVDLIRYKGQMHAFLDKLGVIPQAEDLVIEMSKAIQAMR